MKKARLNVAPVRHVVYHAALGLAYAHGGGVLHRDVKPDNIMVVPTGRVKVMDFGIARVVESPHPAAARWERPPTCAGTGERG